MAIRISWFEQKNLYFYLGGQVPGKLTLYFQTWRKYTRTRLYLKHKARSKIHFCKFYILIIIYFFNKTFEININLFFVLVKAQTSGPQLGESLLPSPGRHEVYNNMVI